MPERNRVISTEQAAITTCTIEVKVIKIDKKQMTLSVFRQLLRRSVIDVTFALLGEPWGIVNYFWDGCGYVYGEHLHVVWTTEGKLYRDCIGELKVSKFNHDPSHFHVTGDSAGVALFGPVGRFNGNGTAYIRLPDSQRPRVEQAVALWNARVRPFYALDQLFIAV
jgi:hypothetical protein